MIKNHRRHNAAFQFWAVPEGGKSISQILSEHWFSSQPVTARKFLDLDNGPSVFASN